MPKNIMKSPQIKNSKVKNSKAENLKVEMQNFVDEETAYLNELNSIFQKRKNNICQKTAKWKKIVETSDISALLKKQAIFEIEHFYGLGLEKIKAKTFQCDVEKGSVENSVHRLLLVVRRILGGYPVKMEPFVEEKRDCCGC